jgi:Formin Homology 2 Domain
MPRLEALHGVFSAVRESEAFGHVLALLLGVGNHLNGGAFNGRCYGFQLTDLPKIIDTRSVDAKFTLLHYIYTLCEEGDDKGPLNWFTDFEKYWDAATRFGESTVREDIGTLEKEGKAAERALAAVEDALKDETAAPLYVAYEKRLRQFLLVAKPQLEALTSAVEKADSAWESLCEAYAEDAKKFSWADLFELLGTFKDQWAGVKEGLAKDRALEERKSAQRAGGGANPLKRQDSLGANYARRRAERATGLGGLMKSAQSSRAAQLRGEVRKSKAIREAETGENAGASLNALLGMLDTMTATSKS